LIIATNPIVAFVAGMFFFHEKISLVNVVGVIICVFGIGMFTMGESSMGPQFIWGVLLLMIAVFAEVGQASFTKALASDYRPMVIVMYQFIFGAIFLLPLFLTVGIRSYDPVVYNSWDAWSSILCLALFCSTLAFSLWVSSIKYLGVAKSSIFQAMIPVVTALANLVFNGKNLTLVQWIGIGIAVCGMILSQALCEKPAK
jgi:drug/metabolite transporter (DMT)-like permease